jgi:preprotein translocase subunit YajC
MLSFEKLKEFFILILTFGVIYWFQQVDDKKRCKRREGIYDNIKLPLLASAIVGLVLFWEKESFLAIFITQEELIPMAKLENSNPILMIEKPEHFIHQVDLSKPNLDVYTEQFEL